MRQVGTKVPGRVDPSLGKPRERTWVLVVVGLCQCVYVLLSVGQVVSCVLCVRSGRKALALLSKDIGSNPAIVEAAGPEFKSGRRDLKAV